MTSYVKPPIAVQAFTRKKSLLSILRGLFKSARFRHKFIGHAYVVDGDTMRVAGRSIRLYGIDAPEIGQLGQNQKGQWYDQGKYVKQQLVNAVGGKKVQVEVVATDKYRRTVGIVFCDDLNINEWLVENGFAISAYGKKYSYAERSARRAKRGLWRDQTSYRPSDWRKDPHRARIL